MCTPQGVASVFMGVVICLSTILFVDPYARMGVRLLIARPGLETRTMDEQVAFGTAYEMLKAAYGIRQASMSEIIKIACDGTKEDIEPYVDYVTWLNAGDPRFQRRQYDSTNEDMRRYKGTLFFEMWNPASVANVRWVALHCQLAEHCVFWEGLLQLYRGWFNVRGLDRSWIHTLS